MKRRLPLFAVLLLLGGLIYLPYGDVIKEFVELKMSGKKTVAERLLQFGPAVRARIMPLFQQCNVHYPPEEVLILAFKNERLMELYAKNAGEDFKRIVDYQILAASGKLGPKLREGDRQVPEGIYRIEYLNPNSLYHLSMKISYPNVFDQSMAQQENRSSLGGDIMIHGNELSIGCLAMGDQVAEDLFVLVAETGLEKVKVVISPVDFRKHQLPNSDDSSVTWIEDLYKELRQELSKYQ